MPYTVTRKSLPALRGAFNAVSQTPERREGAFLSEVQAEIDALYDLASQWEDADALESRLESIAARYLAAINAYLAAMSRCASSFVVGPSKFPSRMMEKRSAVADRRWNEAVKCLDEGRSRLIKDYGPPDPRAPIRIDSDDAESRLQEKLARLEALQATMRAANAVMRSKKPDADKRAELAALGLTDRQINTLLTPDFAGRIGFPDYALKNNSAEIRRLRARMEEVSAESTAQNVVEAYPGVTLREDAGDQRVRLVFDEKPGGDAIAILKARGFKWSPRHRAWQRLLNDAGRSAAREVVRQIVAFQAI